MSWPFVLSKSHIGQSVRRNSFSKYALCYEFHIAFCRPQLSGYFNIELKLKCIT